MPALFRFSTTHRRDPEVESWLEHFAGTSSELGKIVRRWYDVLRSCGDDVRELIHDGRPTVCVGDAAFAYIDAFTAHVSVGFFRGAELPDPGGLLEGKGRSMRHVKLRPGATLDEEALEMLIDAAYTDMLECLAEE